MTRRIFAMTPALAAGLPGAPDYSAVIGVWRGHLDGAPALVMTISDEGEGLSGAILFYMVRRDPGQPVKSSPGIPEPMFRIAYEGTKLDFQVSHSRSHGERTRFDPPVRFRMSLNGAGKAKLKHLDDDMEIAIERM